MSIPAGKDPMPIQVAFGHRLRTDGEIAYVTVTQDGIRIEMTAEQARALATTIFTRLAVKPA